MLYPRDLSDEERRALAAKRARDRQSWGQEDAPKDHSPVLLGELCYLERIARGIRLKDLARRLGVSHVTLIKRERNKGRVEQLALFWERDSQRATAKDYWHRVHRDYEMAI
jgi:hypothetical protein